MTNAERLALIAIGLQVASDLFEFLALYTEIVEPPKKLKTTQQSAPYNPQVDREGQTTVKNGATKKKK